MSERICVGLSDLTPEKQQEFIEAVEKETGRPYYENEDNYEFWVIATITEEGVDFE